MVKRHQVQRIRKHYLRTVERHKVYEVDGGQIRDKLATDFTLGGHHRVYAFIPRKEIWIEQGLKAQDREALIVHEAEEVRQMRGGLSYPKAHAKATTKERRFRRR